MLDEENLIEDTELVDEDDNSYEAPLPKMALLIFLMTKMLL